MDKKNQNDKVSCIVQPTTLGVYESRHPPATVHGKLPVALALLAVLTPSAPTFN